MLFRSPQNPKTPVEARFILLKFKFWVKAIIGKESKLNSKRRWCQLQTRFQCIIVVAAPQRECFSLLIGGGSQGHVGADSNGS